MLYGSSGEVLVVSALGGGGVEGEVLIELGVVGPIGVAAVL